MTDETPGVAPATEFTFRTWPFYWLARAGGRYLLAMEAELRPIGLDIPRWRVLMSLHEERCLSVSEIAGYAIAKLPTMTKIVQRMDAEGLVACRASASDGRVTEVVLTETGREAGRQAWAAANRVYARAFGGASERQVATLNRLLRQIAENLA